MKRIVGQVIFLILIISSVSFASTYDLELNGGDAALEARFNATLPLEEHFLKTGVGAIYRDDEYEIIDVTLALNGHIVVPELQFTIGAKGVAGNIQMDHLEGDLTAIGLLVSGIYTLPKTILPFPLDISASFSLAPKAFCFSDSERYLDIRTSLDFHMVDNGALILGYRYTEIRFDVGNEQRQMSDETLFVGFRIMY